MKVVLGIGNPDEKYADTRHNVGWRVVDALSVKIGEKFRKAGFEFWAAEGRLGRREVALVRTWTYVNGTGRVIPELLKRYGDEILVVCDDVDLPVGRLRIGIGGGQRDPAYVLGRPGRDEKPLLDRAVEEACEAVRCWMDEGIEKCMTRFNRRVESENV